MSKYVFATYLDQLFYYKMFCTCIHILYTFFKYEIQACLPQNKELGSRIGWHLKMYLCSSKHILRKKSSFAGDSHLTDYKTIILIIC
jgi:hypothetical protein